VSGRAGIRPATAADLAGIAAVLHANGEPMTGPEGPGEGYLDHILGRGRMPVAELDGAIVGFGGSIRLGDAVMLTDLFVDPDRHEHGLGGALLAAALGGDTPRMTFSSADPRALSLYVRAGMRPWWPNLYLEAPAGAADLLLLAHDVTIEPATLEETAASSLALTGVDRAADYAHYAAMAGGAGFVVRQGRAIAAVGWGRPGAPVGRTLHHAVIAHDADPVQAALGAIRAVTPDGGQFSGCVPGPHPVLPVLLEAGFRIADRDTFCASDPSWLDPVRILPNPSLL
jgi:GNAT superfamily N-acetyltransferase